MLHQLKDQANYDERQIMERGRAFKYAYLTMLFCLLALYAVHSLTGLAIAHSTMFSILFWVSATVLHYHTVRRSAFDGLTKGQATPVLAAVMFGGGCLSWVRPVQAAQLARTADRGQHLDRAGWQPDCRPVYDNNRPGALVLSAEEPETLQEE